MKKMMLLLSGIILPIALCVGGVYMLYPQQSSTFLNEIKENFEISNINKKEVDKSIFYSDGLKEKAHASVDILAGLQPRAGDEMHADFEAEGESITTKGVLVPRQKTLIMGRPDHRIKVINVRSGDRFRKGDVLLEYNCEKLNAELEVAKSEYKLAEAKKMATSRLFNLELSSGIELAQAQTQGKKAKIDKVIAERRYASCVVRAEYNGHVTKKWANDKEYIGVNRKVLEIVSNETLEVTFKMPSKALRWVNIGSPVFIHVDETDQKYDGKIQQIFGEIDPETKTIQVRARLDGYMDNLLPGMSGALTIMASDTQEKGIVGFVRTAAR